MSNESKSDDKQKLRRVVVEVEPGLHRRLKANLALKGMSLKAWYLRMAKQELGEK